MSEYLNNKEKTDETLKYHEEDLEPGGVGGLGDGSVFDDPMESVHID